MAFSPRTILKKFHQAIAVHEEESRNAQLSRPVDRIDRQLLTVILSAAVILSWLDYYGSSGDWQSLEFIVAPFIDDAEALLRGIFRDREYGRLTRLAYWSGTTILGYFVVPALIVRFILKERLADYGLSFGGGSVPFGLTLALFLFMLPAIVFVAFTDSFQSTYPFYQHADRSIVDLIAWLMIYGGQFFALEFFYRGFLIHGLKRRFGVYSILVSTIPYTMIHFGKPMPETLGSIVAGVALGAISYHYKSIWPAVVLHVAIAVSMDLFSLSAQGRLFGL